MIEAERAGARLRFTEFVVSHVSPDFYRNKAGSAISPVRGPDLRRALNTAYAIRSNDVHALRDLPPEAWSWVGSADTVDVPGLGRILTHRRTLPARAPRRTRVPGQGTHRPRPRLQLARCSPRPADRHTRTAVLGLAGRRSEQSVDPDVLRRSALTPDRPEDARGHPDRGPVRPCWNESNSCSPTCHPVHPDDASSSASTRCGTAPSPRTCGRPDADTLLGTFSTDLTTPSAIAFAVGLLTDALPSWTSQECLDLATARHTERAARKPRPLPQGIDTALLLIAAERCADTQMTEDAATLAAWAGEELPGTPTCRPGKNHISADGFADSVACAHSCSPASPHRARTKPKPTAPNKPTPTS